ncbi:MAG TPA: Mpo1-like protein [Casimicrobiaceae bacterium]
MRKIDELFGRYDASHRNATNKAIHWICVPLIVWSVLAALWAWTPLAAYAVIALAIAYYVSISLPLALGMLAFSTAIVLTLMVIPSHLPIVAAIVFVAAWIGQFIGHKIEGKKPSFFEDLTFLMIGPAWLLGLVYRRFGIPY